MDNEKLVSVKMLTYNHEDYIAEAIDSVLNQKTNFSYELVIGEDCSTDNTRRIIESYRVKHPQMIKLITSEKNVGMHANSERVNEACKGEYLAFCEGDDFWNDPYKLQKQYDIIKSNPDYGLVHSDCNFFYQKDKKLLKSFHKHNKIKIPVGNVFEDLLSENFIRTLTVFGRKDLIIENVDYKLFKSLGWKFGDYPSWLEISLITKIGYIDEPMATYRVLKESASHSLNNSKMLELVNSSFEIAKYFLKKYNCIEEIKKKVYDKHNKKLLRYGFRTGDKLLIKSSYKKLELRDLTFLDKIFYYFSKTYLSRQLIVIVFRLRSKWMIYIPNLVRH